MDTEALLGRRWGRYRYRRIQWRKKGQLIAGTELSRNYAPLQKASGRADRPNPLRLVNTDTGGAATHENPFADGLDLKK